MCVCVVCVEWGGGWGGAMLKFHIFLVLYPICLILFW